MRNQQSQAVTMISKLANGVIASNWSETGWTAFAWKNISDPLISLRQERSNISPNKFLKLIKNVLNKQLNLLTKLSRSEVFLNFSTAVDSHGFRFSFFRLLNNVVVVNVFEVTRDVGGAADADIVGVDGVAQTNQLSGDIDVLQRNIDYLNVSLQNLMQVSVTHIEIEEL